MANIDLNGMPAPNRYLYDLIRKETKGNVTAFAKKINVSQQMVDMLLKPDKKTGEYKNIFPSVRVAVSEFFGINESWAFIESYESEQEQRPNELGNEPVIIEKLIDEIKQLTEINDRNSKSLEKLINLIIKDENIK